MNTKRAKPFPATGASEKRRHYTIKCQRCGKEYFPHRRQQKFCSLTCGASGRIGHTAKRTATIQCHNCGNDLERKQYLVHHNARHFCSRNCKSAFESKFSRGKNNPNYSNAGAKTCIGCGKPYKSYQPGRKFCGVDCSQRFLKSFGITQSARGLFAEKLCAKELTLRGYHCTISKGSRGAYDVIAVSNSEILLIQVKRTGTPNRICLPKELGKLRAAPAPIGAFIKKQLWSLIDGRGWNIKTL